MASRFLFNETLWEELRVRIPEAKMVRAAVAYMGAGGSKLLPLRKGDKLLVDMSLQAVRSGTTDPREVQKLLKKGVVVYTRQSLHAKFFVIDRVVIAGSSNISNNAKNSLDEAALLTDDAAAVRGAISIFEQMCSEPVRKEYLDKCLQEYRPPRLPPTGTGGRPTGTKREQSKLWIIGGLSYRALPEREHDDANKVVKRAAKRLLNFEKAEVNYSHFATKPRFLDEVREGAFIVRCIKDGTGFDVYPPARVLGIESYPRGNGKKRYLLLSEVPTDESATPWSTVRGAVPASISPARGQKPRTTPIVNQADADAILRLWDLNGKFLGGKR